MLSTRRASTRTSYFMAPSIRSLSSGGRAWKQSPVAPSHWSCSSEWGAVWCRVRGVLPGRQPCSSGPSSREPGGLAGAVVPGAEGVLLTGLGWVLFFLPWTGSEHFHPTSPAWSQVKVSIFISLSAHALLHLPGEAARKSGKSLACGIHRIRGRCQLCHR